MKKLALVLSIIAMVAFVGCSKEKNCKCVTSTTGVGDVETTMTIQDGDCEDMNIETTTMGITQKVTCTEE